MASEDDAILASIAAATTRLRARAEARQSRDAAQVEALEARASRVARRCPPAGGRGEAGADAAEGEACDALAALERQTAAAVDRCALQRAKYAEKPRFDGMRQDAWTARLRRRDELARLAVLARETPATAARRRAESEVREARWRREAAWGFVTAAAEKRSASVEALRRGYPWWTSPLQGAGLQLAGAKISRGDADDLDEWRCTAAERTVCLPALAPPRLKGGLAGALRARPQGGARRLHRFGYGDARGRAARAAARSRAAAAARRRHARRRAARRAHAVAPRSAPTRAPEAPPRRIASGPVEPRARRRTARGAGMPDRGGGALRGGEGGRRGPIAPRRFRRGRRGALDSCRGRRGGRGRGR
ncbi:hypothetical protein M885DRAFT_507060 [Pelagophyceae sp. CCMP2097]|nr:hypothetical protein M885DRAFT_507060 [Pelagophyceae sp. CCMP2097]